MMFYIFSFVYNLTINRLTNEERLQIMEFYYQNACSAKKVHCALLPFNGQFNRPTKAAIRAIVTKFRTKFTLLDIKPSTRLRRVRIEENIAADHILSIRRGLQQLGLCYSTTWTILRKDFRCAAFQNTAGARIEAERPTARQNFWLMGS